MNEITWTNEDVKLVEKFIEIKKRGFYVSGQELTSAYNRILHKNRGVTNCGQCLSQMVGELEQALNHFKQKMALESVSEPQVDEAILEPSDEVTETEVEDAEIMKDRMAKVRAARKNKKNEQ